MYLKTIHLIKIKCVMTFLYEKQLYSTVTDGTPVIKSADVRYAPSNY